MSLRFQPPLSVGTSRMDIIFYIHILQLQGYTEIYYVIQ